MTMRVIALLLIVPKYQLLSEATPRTIVGTEGAIKVLLPEYQVYTEQLQFKILNCRPFSDGFLVYFISVF